MCGAIVALEVLDSIGLDVQLEVATDPFFGRSGRMLAASQREQQLKFEVLTRIAGPEPTAVASFNYHQEHFSSAYGLQMAGGGAAHTACLGFGLERVHDCPVQQARLRRTRMAYGDPRELWQE